MKLTLTILAVLVPAFLAIGLAGDAQGDDLQAVYNLSGVLQDLANKELTVTFSDDMLPLGGRRDGASLVRITPAIQGEFSWRGNRTLAFKPKPRFRYSTTYTAVIPAGTRSLAGKALPREIRWQWSTPQAYPVEVKTISQEYFSPLRTGKKPDFPVWVKDSLVLNFKQPVSAADAGAFFILKEAKSGDRTPIRLLQKGGAGIEVRCEKELRRGEQYQLIIKKGFHGREGSTGTAKDFFFFFDTVPPFQFAGKEPLVLFPDASVAWLPFTNELAEFSENLIRVFRITGDTVSPLKFHVEPRYYRNQGIFLRVDAELASGDRLGIRIDRNLTSIFNEQLKEDLDIEAKVCSSRSPRLDFSLRDGKLSLSAKSMKRAEVQLLKLKPDFFTQLHKNGFAIMKQNDFRSRYVEKELFQRLENLPEKANAPILRDAELGSPLGFFATLVRRYEPYNACRDIALMRLPAANPPKLDVFHRRNMDMVVKYSQEQTLFWLYDNRSGRALGNMPFFLAGNDGEARRIGQAQENGILLSDKGIDSADLVLAKNPAANDVALARIGHAPPSDREVRIQVFSDRDFYKPGETVHVAGIVKEYASGKVSSLKAKQAVLEISGPDRQKVKTTDLSLDAWGGFHYEFQSDPAGKKGRYQILVRIRDEQYWQGGHGVTIDFYQPNTMEVKIAGVSERYAYGDTFRARVSGSYLAGNPMAGDDLSASLQTDPAAGRVFAVPGLERHHFGLDRDLAQDDPPWRVKDKLDADGEFTFSVPMHKFNKTNYLARLRFAATGKSAEGKEFTARANSLYFPGGKATGIRVGFYQNLKEQVKADLALVDVHGKPVEGEIRLTLYRENYDGNRRKLEKISGPEDVFIARTKTHKFAVSTPGRYVLRCDTPDGEGRIVSTSASFFAWDSGYSDRDDRLAIESEQKLLRAGETLKCFIRSPRAGQALVTVERGKVLESRVIALQKMTPLEIPVKKAYFPAFRVGVVAMYTDNVSEQAAKDFTVEDDGKTLQVTLESPAEIKPASTTSVRIKVTDARKKSARAKLFVYAVDEGNLSLQGYRTPDLLQRFYHLNPLGRNAIRTYYSKNFSHWTFAHPLLDIELSGPAVFGRVVKPDATPLAGATVTLEDADFRKLRTAVTSQQGYYKFPGMAAGRYAIKAEAGGFHPSLLSDIHFNGRDHRQCNLALIPTSLEKFWEEAERSLMDDGVMPAAPMMAQEAKSLGRMKGEEAVDGGMIGGVLGDMDAAIAGIRVRSDFQEVLFFRVIETDDAGNATVDFKSSDQLSTYRVMAVAYSEDSFGKAEKRLLVSKDLLISEAMPEFARQGDEFSAGAQLSNRTAQKLPFTLLAKPTGIAIRGADRIKGILDPRGNGLFQFPFLAERIGEAKVEFFAISTADKDGLEKTFPVSDRLVSETLLDFASGREVKKLFAPQAEAEGQSISTKGAPPPPPRGKNPQKTSSSTPMNALNSGPQKSCPSWPSARSWPSAWTWALTRRRSARRSMAS